MRLASSPALDAAEPDLAQQLHARGGQFLEVLLDHALLDHRRPGMDLDPAGTEGVEGALRGDRQRLDADDILRPAGQMHLAGRDHGGDAAMEEAVDPVELALARRPVAEDGMDMAVDQAGGERRALGVDLDRGACSLSRSFALPMAVILPSIGDDGIGIEDRMLEIAREQQADIADHQLAGGSAGALCLSHGSYPLAFCGR